MDYTDALYVEGTTGVYAAGAKDFYALIFNAESIDDATQYLVKRPAICHSRRTQVVGWKLECFLSD